MKEENRSALKFRLEVSDKAFGGNLGGELQGKRKFTAKVARAQEQVRKLDRYDDFRELKIGTEQYKLGGGKYGIPFVKDTHLNGEVIFPWQKEAALSFLRDLRGFGLLADVVGSGKTFEAALVLSELAVRNKIKSVLIVAPHQVFDNWVDVLEMKFGMGEGVLYQVRKRDGERPPRLEDVIASVGSTRDGDFFRPNRPIIADTDVFVDWRMGSNTGLLFDAIVVDEAHHFSDEKGHYANALVLLSQFMQAKKKAGVPYCLLLSATPHSGNLADMFRLWYFIRCKGGKPSDFIENGDRSKEYSDEREYYLQNICHGASSVPEFVRNVRRELVSSKQYEDALEKFLSSKGKTREQYDAMPDYEKDKFIDKLLSDSSLKDKIEQEIASKYHGEVLRSIMIRQPNRLKTKKNIRNVFFYPMNEPEKSVNVTALEHDVTVDFSALDADFDPLVTCEGERIPLRQFAKEYGRNIEYPQAARTVINAVIGALKSAEESRGGDRIFTKKGYVSFYSDRMSGMFSATQSATVLPVKVSSDKLGYKFEYAKKIMRAHKKERILVFFDYELPKKETVYDEFADALKKDKEFSSRVLIYDSKGGAGDEQKSVAERKFKEKSDAILIVKNASLTEGSNLQDCNIMINFQVSPDPVAMDQRIGRIFRLGQKNDVTVYSLADMNKLEGFALAYFGGIGLLASNSGDATILAGSNCDQMVAVRCKECKKVMLMPRQEFRDEMRKYERGAKVSKLVCDAKPECKENSADGKGTLMTEISVYDFKCDVCGAVMSRSVSDEGYRCISTNLSGMPGKMCNTGEKDDREIYCRKICAIANCNRFRDNKALREGCAALALYRERPNVGDNELMLCCSNCKIDECSAKCKITDIGAGQIGWDSEEKEYSGLGCHNCPDSGCSPTPHVLDFDENWEADCPSCGSSHGRLRPIVAKTFATFIRESWKFEYDGGESFCTSLSREAKNVETIRKILAMDDERG